MTQVNLTIDLNKNRGNFSGEFNLSEAVNSFYDDYDGAVINSLSIASNPVLGAIATVRIRGGSLDVNSYKPNWQAIGDPISTFTTDWNILTILYADSNDIRVVNNVTVAALTYSEILSNFAKLALDSTEIDLNNATNVRTDGSDKFLINWIDDSSIINDASQANNTNQFQLDLTDKFLTQLGDSYLVLDNSTTITGSSGFSVYFVLDKDDSDLFQVILGLTGNTSPAVYSAKSGSNYVFRIQNSSGTVQFILNGASDLLGKKIFEVHHDGNSNAEILINGVLIDSISNAPNIDFIFNQIGRRDIGNYLEGDIYGIFNFDLLSQLDRFTVRQELSNKYSIAI